MSLPSGPLRLVLLTSAVVAAAWVGVVMQGFLDRVGYAGFASSAALLPLLLGVWMLWWHLGSAIVAQHPWPRSPSSPGWRNCCPAACCWRCSCGFSDAGCPTGGSILSVVLLSVLSTVARTPSSAVVLRRLPVLAGAIVIRTGRLWMAVVFHISSTLYLAVAAPLIDIRILLMFDLIALTTVTILVLALAGPHPKDEAAPPAALRASGCV